jgi:hypothetical protein
MGANFHFFNSEEYKSHFKIEDYLVVPEKRRLAF